MFKKMQNSRNVEMRKCRDGEMVALLHFYLSTQMNFCISAVPSFFASTLLHF